MKADRPDQLVYANHCDDQHFQRHIPFRKGPSQYGGECNGQSTLRYQPEPSIVYQISTDGIVTTGPPHSRPEAGGPQSREQERPLPDFGEGAELEVAAQQREKYGI